MSIMEDTGSCFADYEQEQRLERQKKWSCNGEERRRFFTEAIERVQELQPFKLLGVDGRRMDGRTESQEHESLIREAVTGCLTASTRALSDGWLDIKKIVEPLEIKSVKMLGKTANNINHKLLALHELTDLPITYLRGLSKISDREFASLLEKHFCLNLTRESMVLVVVKDEPKRSHFVNFRNLVLKPNVDNDLQSPFTGMYDKRTKEEFFAYLMDQLQKLHKMRIEKIGF